MTRNQNDETANRYGFGREVYRAGAIPPELIELVEHAKAWDAAASFDDEMAVKQGRSGDRDRHTRRGGPS